MTNYLLILKFINTDSPEVGKRLALIFIVLLLAAISALWYFVRQGHKEVFTDPYRAVPADAALVVETSDLRSFLNSLSASKGVAGELSSIREMDGFTRKVRLFAEQVNKPDFNLLISENPSVIAFLPASTGRMEPLLAMTLSPHTGEKELVSLLSRSGMKHYRFKTSSGREMAAFPFELEGRKDTVFISVVSGLMLASLSSPVIEKAVGQTGRGEDIRSVPGFSRVLKASGTDQNKVFFVMPSIAGPFRKLLKPEASDLANMLSAVTGTTGADLYIGNDGIMLNGYTDNTDSTSFIGKYKMYEGMKFGSFRVIPASAIMFITERFKPDTGALLRQGGRMSETAARLASVSEDEISRVLLDIREQPVTENMIVLVALKNGQAAEQIYTGAAGTDREVLYYSPDDQSRIAVYKNAFSGLTNLLASRSGTGPEDTYIAFFNNFLVAGISYKSVTRFIYENILNKTLANDLLYRDFESTLPTTAGYQFYCLPSKLTEWLSFYVRDDIAAALRSYKGQLSKLQAAGFQLSASNGMVYGSAAFVYREEAREESNTEWETLLDTAAAVKPFFFTNHNSGAKEIFVQDARNNVYLINSAGRVLWKVPLREKINGSIYMVDIYRNGKYQLLFSGKNYIHLLDRNGNYVDRYPVKLRSPASNGLALFDYDNNLNYRFFIAGEDRRIYSYDRSGNTVKGWKQFQTSGFVREELRYFRVSGKDYIVASDGSALYFLDRTGNVRVSLKEPVAKASGSALRLTQGSTPSAICTSDDGSLVTIGFDGSVKRQKIRDLSIDHRFDFFDIDGDGFGEYIFIDKGILYLYDHDMKEMFTRDFATENLAGPINFVFSSSERMTGVADLNAKRIYLIDKYGETMNGFPLRGASMFSIGKLSEKGGWNLIVGGTDSFLYNYKLDAETK